MRTRGRYPRAARSLCLGTAIASILVLGTLDAAPTAAQPITSLEFSFSNPGARSLGFGGAFVALADDATAAFANPAGLVQIARPELSIDGRTWDYSTPFTRGGRAAGEPTGMGIDTVAGPLRGESSARLSGLSYAAYVHPGKRWSFALFGHQLANFEFALESQGVFGPGQSLDTARTDVQRGQVDLEIVTFGLAAAFRPTERLSLGVALSRFDVALDFSGRDYLVDDDTLEAFFGEASFLPDRLVQTVEFRTVEPDWGLGAGFLWRLSDRWNLGGVYREGPRAGLAGDVVAGAAHPLFPAGFQIVDGFRTGWNLPNVWALGLAYRSRDGRWTGAAEWKRVGYSRILDSLLPQQRDPGDFLDDADEIHIGGEYAFFAGTAVWAIRAGAWHDPDHSFGTRSEEPFLRALIVPGEDQLHLALGVGVAAGDLQVDLGIDLSERTDTVSLSLIHSFGG